MTTQNKLTAAAIAATAALSSGSAAAETSLDHPGFTVQIVRFTSTAPREKILGTAVGRKPEFEAMPGLVQKYYVEYDEPNTYGGIYIWESKAAMGAFLQTDLFATIREAYEFAGPPEVTVVQGLFPLR